MSALECPRCKEITLVEIGRLLTNLHIGDDGHTYKDLTEYECTKCRHYETHHRTRVRDNELMRHAQSWKDQPKWWQIWRIV